MYQEFEALQKQASHMKKLAESWNSQDESNYQALVKKYYDTPEYRNAVTSFRAKKKMTQDAQQLKQSPEYAQLKSVTEKTRSALSKEPLAQRAFHNPFVPFAKQASYMKKLANSLDEDQNTNG